jgi:hypothetical protein
LHFLHLFLEAMESTPTPWYTSTESFLPGAADK